MLNVECSMDYEGAIQTFNIEHLTFPSLGYWRRAPQLS